MRYEHKVIVAEVIVGSGSKQAHNINIKSCPFCDYADCKVRTRGTWKIDHVTLAAFWVECPYCGATGPRSDKHIQEAIIRWNNVGER